MAFKIEDLIPKIKLARSIIRDQAIKDLVKIQKITGHTEMNIYDK